MIKYQPFGVASSGDNTLIGEVAEKRFRVIALFLLAADAVNLYIKDATATLLGNATNKVNLPANGGFVLPENSVGWFVSHVGEPLVINLSGAVGVSGVIVYEEF